MKCETTVKLHYIEPQGTDVNSSIYLRFEIHLFALIVAGLLQLFNKTGSSKYQSFAVMSSIYVV